MTDIVERLREDARGGKAYHELSDEAADEIERLRSDLGHMESKRNTVQATLFATLEENERLEETLQRIEQWSRAYPLTVFPEPDLKRARELLEAGGMTLDAISADAMRHVVESAGRIARKALK